MYLLHYYVQKGWHADDFLALDTESRAFYAASMLAALEEKAAMFEGAR